MASPSRAELKTYVGMGSRDKKGNVHIHVQSPAAQTYVLSQRQSRLWSIQKMDSLGKQRPEKNPKDLGTQTYSLACGEWVK